MLVVETRLSPASMAEFAGAAVATVKGYMSSMRDYLRFAAAWQHAKTTPWAGPDALVEYAFHRQHPTNRAWPKYSYSMKASVAGDLISKIPSAFRRFGIRFQGVQKPSMIKNVLAFRQPNGGVVHREAIDHSGFLATLQACRNGHAATLPSVMCALMYFGMMRTKEPLSISVDHHTRLRDKTGKVVGIAMRFFDKTHKQTRREVLFTSRKMWTAEFDLLTKTFRRAQRMRRKAATSGAMDADDELRIFSCTDQKMFALHLMATTRLTPGCMRPGGLMYHVGCRQSQWLTIKQGGWSPDSKVFVRAYTRLCHPDAVARFKEAE